MAAINESLTYAQFLDKQDSCCHQKSDVCELKLFTDRKFNPEIAVFTKPRNSGKFKTGGQYNVLDIDLNSSGGSDDLERNYNKRPKLKNLMNSLQKMFSGRESFLADFKIGIPPKVNTCLNIEIWLDVTREYNGVCNLLRHAKDRFPIVVWNLQNDADRCLDCLGDEECFQGFSIVDPFINSDGGDGTYTGLDLTSLANIKSALSKERHYLSCREGSHFFFHEGWDIRSRSIVSDAMIVATVKRLSETLFLKYFNK